MALCLSCMSLFGLEMKEVKAIDQERERGGRGVARDIFFVERFVRPSKYMDRNHTHCLSTRLKGSQPRAEQSSSCLFQTRFRRQLDSAQTAKGPNQPLSRASASELDYVLL